MFCELRYPLQGTSGDVEAEAASLARNKFKISSASNKAYGSHLRIGSQLCIRVDLASFAHLQAHFGVLVTVPKANLA